MARYKRTDGEKGQGVFLSVNLKEQLIPGTEENMRAEERCGMEQIMPDKEYKKRLGDAAERTYEAGDFT